MYLISSISFHLLSFVFWRLHLSLVAVQIVERNVTILTVFLSVRHTFLLICVPISLLSLFSYI